MIRLYVCPRASAPVPFVVVRCVVPRRGLSLSVAACLQFVWLTFLFFLMPTPPLMLPLP